MYTPSWYQTTAPQKTSKYKSPVACAEDMNAVLNEFRSYCYTNNHDKLYDLVYENCFFAGGCVRDLFLNVKPKDWDIFFTNAQAAKEFLLYVLLDPVLQYVFKVYKDSNRTFTLKIGGKTLQFITLTSGPPDKVVSEFDFQINANYYFPKTGKIDIDEHLETGDVALRMQPRCINPYSAMSRVPKLLSKGFSISPQELVKLTYLCSLSGLSKNEIKKQCSSGMSDTFDVEF